MSIGQLLNLVAAWLAHVATWVANTVSSVEFWTSVTWFSAGFFFGYTVKVMRDRRQAKQNGKSEAPQNNKG